MKAIRALFANLIALALLPVCAYAAGPTVQTLHSFTGGADGVRPEGNLVSDAVGNLYGTTVSGGSNVNCLGGTVTGCGIVFKLSPPQTRGGVWKETVLYRFSGGADGAFPAAGLILDQRGDLYGTTQSGGTFNGVCGNAIDFGCGVVFELSPQVGGAWKETVLYSFTGQSDGGVPVANLIFDGSGNLYGTTQAGGDYLGCWCGTVFELSPNGAQGWTETVLYQFQGDFDAAYLWQAWSLIRRAIYMAQRWKAGQMVAMALCSS